MKHARNFKYILLHIIYSNVLYRWSNDDRSTSIVNESADRWTK